MSFENDKFKFSIEPKVLLRIITLLTGLITVVTLNI